MRASRQSPARACGRVPTREAPLQLQVETRAGARRRAGRARGSRGDATSDNPFWRCCCGYGGGGARPASALARPPNNHAIDEKDVYRG